MKQNVGLTDRIIRIMIAIILGSIYYMDFVSGVAATIVLILAVIALVTGIVGYCLLYALVDINTAKHEDQE